MNAINTAPKTIYMSLDGLPLTFELNWPFHPSTSGSDWWVLHGTIRVENTNGLHALVAVNLSATVKQALPSLAVQDAQAPVINALRKQVDRKQVEFLKSAKLLPVYFSSRQYDFKRNRWVFEKATDQQIMALLERKVYWQTLATGGAVPLADMTEAQYLDTSLQRLTELAEQLVQRGLIRLKNDCATAEQPLLSQSDRFHAELKRALEALEQKHAFERG